MISILIPMYNSSKTIKECLNKILEQNTNYIEIILIDDNSTDDTYNVCSKYVKEYNFIKLYKNDKKGVSTARNYGIKKSNGDYIIFIDSDDFLIDNAINEIKENLSGDMIIYGFSYVNKNLKVLSTVKDEKYHVTKEEFVEKKLLKYIDNSLMYSVWNKVFKRKIIEKNNLFFNENFNFNEDILFCLNYLKNCNNIVNIDKSLYLYVCDTSGLSKKYNKNNYIALNTVYNAVIEIYGDSTSKYLNNIFLYKILEDINKLSISSFEQQQKIELIKSIRNSKMFLDIKKYSNINDKNILIINLLSLRMYRLIILIYKMKTCRKER